MMALDLRLSVAIIACSIVIGSVYADQCDSDHNTNILERAFGVVIHSKLESQTAAISTMFDNKLNEQTRIVQTMLAEQAARFDEKIKEVKSIVETVETLIHILAPGWTRVLDSLIWLSSETANNFEEATQKCTEMGARLFEPQTLRQNNAVYALLKAKGRDQHNHWIGIHDQLEENK